MKLNELFLDPKTARAEVFGTTIDRAKITTKSTKKNTKSANILQASISPYLSALRFCALLCAFCGEMSLPSIQSISMPNASGARGINIKRV
jgi:hypothetical protein